MFQDDFEEDPAPGPAWVTPARAGAVEAKVAAQVQQARAQSQQEVTPESMQQVTAQEQQARVQAQQAADQEQLQRVAALVQQARPHQAATPELLQQVKARVQQWKVPAQQAAAREQLQRVAGQLQQLKAQWQKAATPEQFQQVPSQVAQPQQAAVQLLQVEPGRAGAEAAQQQTSLGQAPGSSPGLRVARVAQLTRQNQELRQSLAAARQGEAQLGQQASLLEEKIGVWEQAARDVISRESMIMSAISRKVAATPAPPAARAAPPGEAAPPAAEGGWGP